MFGKIINVNFNPNTILSLIYFSTFTDMLLPYHAVSTLAIHFHLKKHKLCHLSPFTDLPLSIWSTTFLPLTSYCFLSFFHSYFFLFQSSLFFLVLCSTSILLCNGLHLITSISLCYISQLSAEIIAWVDHSVPSH